MKRRMLLTVVLLGWATLGAGCSISPERSCESEPIDQLRLGGVNYVRSPESVTQDELGEQIGTVDRPLPHAAFRCGTYSLEDGMGTHSVGSAVYSVSGHDPSELVAVLDPTYPNRTSPEPQLFKADTEGVLG